MILIFHKQVKLFLLNYSYVSFYIQDIDIFSINYDYRIFIFKRKEHILIRLKFVHLFPGKDLDIFCSIHFYSKRFFQLNCNLRMAEYIHKSLSGKFDSIAVDYSYLFKSNKKNVI